MCSVLDRQCHDFLICFDARTVDLIAEYAAVHSQQLKTLENQSANLQANSVLKGFLSKHFFVQKKALKFELLFHFFTVNDPC